MTFIACRDLVEEIQTRPLLVCYGFGNGITLIRSRNWMGPVVAVCDISCNGGASSSHWVCPSSTLGPWPIPACMSHAQPPAQYHHSWMPTTHGLISIFPFCSLFFCCPPFNIVALPVHIALPASKRVCIGVETFEPTWLPISTGCVLSGRDVGRWEGALSGNWTLFNSFLHSEIFTEVIVDKVSFRPPSLRWLLVIYSLGKR